MLRSVTTIFATMAKMVCVFIIILFQSINISAQTNFLTIKMENVPLGEILQEIKNQSGKNILYNHTIGNVYKNESINIKNFTYIEALNTCLKDKGLQYKIVDNLIIIELKEQDNKFKQTIKGIVLDENTDIPLIGASIILLGSNPVKGTITDINGIFVLTDVPIGRQGLKISYVGYNPVFIKNIYLNSGKEIDLKIKLEEKVYEGEEITIKAFSRKDLSNNEMAQVSARSFTIEETEKYAGSLGDPARMASSYAGVLTAGSQTNDIVIRGNSPNGLLWRMNGLDIPNPNHFGSISSTGGSISMLNNNVLRNSDFLSGAFPAEYGNALSGVFDLNLRTGNNLKREYTAQAGIFGTELGVEGPFVKGKRASYLIDYRYSTLAIFDKLNLSIGTDGIPKYHDLNYHIYIPTTKLGAFSFYGIIGKNQITSNPKSDTVIDKFSLKGETYFSGVSHNYIFNEKSSLTTSFGYSTIKEGNDYIMVINNSKRSEGGYQNSINNTQLNADFKHKINSKNSFKAGINYQFYNTSFADSTYLKDYGIFIERMNVKGSLYLSQSYIQWKYKLNDEFTFVGGFNQIHSNRGNENIIQPRIGLTWELNTKQSINIGYGKHSHLQPLFVYFNKILVDTVKLKYNQPNLNLKFTRANHYVLGYNYLFTDNLRLKIEGYLQQLYQVPVEKNSSYLSLINYGSSYTIYEYWELENKGTGYNVGTEITFEKFFSGNYYYLLTFSLFDSKYRGSDDTLRNTRFNVNGIINAIGGYEWPLKNQNALAIDIKTTWAGGQRRVQIDAEASRKAEKTIFNTSNAFEERYKDYFRFDFRISYKINKQKLSHILALDIINATMRNNHLIEIYDPVTGEIGEASFVTVMPSFLWRMNF